MRAKQAATIRAGVLYGRTHAAIAQNITHGRYPINRAGASFLQWRATAFTVRHQLRNWDSAAIEYDADTITVTAGGRRVIAPAGTEPKPPRFSYAQGLQGTIHDHD